MNETHEFYVPNYFSNFSCKMGKCRTACCEGWPVSISMGNYFRLLGIDCREDLRRRLDCGMRMAEHPSEDEYAQFVPRYDGNCPMRMEDGRCSLHAELGEEILPDVCCLYPRGIRFENNAYEASCANSCEAALELMFGQDAPITFEKRKMNMRIPPFRKRSEVFESLGYQWQIRHHFIKIMQDRAMPIPMRLAALGLCLNAFDDAVKKRDSAAVERILADNDEKKKQFLSVKIKPNRLDFGLDIMEKMITLLDARSSSIRDYGEAALAYFGKGGDAFSKYTEAKAHFDCIFPKSEIYFEHMLVNHMYFSVFPFQDRPEALRNEFAALCAVYALLRFLGIGWMADKQELDDFVDVMAAAFRLIDHTEFDRYAAHMLKKSGCDDPQKLYDLISL